MELTSLSLTNFRNFRSLSLALGLGLTVIQGENAAGKSNLLEAVFLLAIGKSYRAVTDRDLVSWETAAAGGYAVASVAVQRAEGLAELRIGLECAGGPLGMVRKRVQVNGVARRIASLVGILNAVLFTTDDIDVVFGPPQGRRRYMDLLLSQTDRRYMQALQRYQRVLSQRNHLLRRIRDGRASDHELAFWDDSLCREAAVILHARLDAMERLRPFARASFGRLAAPADEFTVDYVATAPAAGTGATLDDYAAGMADALMRTRVHERVQAITVVGPHRDDLWLTLNGVEAARHASRGQARLAALSLKLAEGDFLTAMRGEAPVLLLDDVLSELDEPRRSLVMNEIQRYPQALLTTADLLAVPDHAMAGARRLRVADGRVLEGAAA